MYRWHAVVDMRANPTILLLLMKTIVSCFCVVGTILAFLLFSDGRQSLGGSALIVLGAAAVGVAIAYISYAIYSAVLGGTYEADYLMDDTGVVFKASSRETRALYASAAMAAVAGLVSGHWGITAASIAASDNEAATRFASVWRLKGIRRQGVIKASEVFLYNQVYVAPQDYDFVYSFMLARCPKARATSI